jgi:hypothetical protein
MTAEQDQEHRTAKRTARRGARSAKASVVRTRHSTKRRRAALTAAPAPFVGNDAKSLGIAMIFTATLGLIVTSLLLSKRRRSVF